MRSSFSARVNVCRSTLGAIDAGLSAFAARRTQRASTATGRASVFWAAVITEIPESPHEEQGLPFRPLVVNTLGLAKRAFQRFRGYRADFCRNTDGVLDEDRDLLGVGGQAAAVPMFGAGFGQHGHFVHAAFAGEFDDKVAAAPVGRQQRLLDLGRE